MENNIVYVVHAFGGEYEDRWDELLSVTFTLEDAEKIIKDYCAMYDEKNWPMTMEEYQNANYGYADDNTGVHIDRDGFTAEQFEEMDGLTSLRYLDLSGVMVDEVEVNGKPIKSHWYNTKGEKPNNISEFFKR